jgi:thiamine-phosphate pyrophosphorylase
MQSQAIGFKVYLISDIDLFSSSDSLLRGIEEALAGGIKAVQLREKNMQTRELLTLAYKFRELTARYRASLFINDRLDIALAVDADGLHLGQSGIPAAVARKAARRNLKIGCSTHSLEEATEAERQGADFITFGPIFETPSKMKYGKPLGLHALKDAGKEIKIPIFGIGGIKKDNIAEVLHSGARGIALISGILADSDKTGAAREYLKRTGER